MKFVFLIYVIHLLLVMIPLYLFFKPISETLGRSPFANGLTGGLDPSVIPDLLFQSSRELGVAFSSILVLFRLVIITDIFLDGGILSVLLKDENGIDSQAFFGGCGRYFLPFLRLFSLSVLLIITAVAVYVSIGSILGIVKEGLSDEVASTCLLFGKWSIFPILLGLVNLCLDYTKISMVETARRNAARLLRESLRFVWRNRWKTITLYLVLSIFIILLHGAYFLVSEVFYTGTWTGILSILVLQQLFVFSRIWMRFCFFSSQGALFQGLQGDPTDVASNR